jgi:hypothetical protein
MFCHCVLLDEAMASWENFCCVLCSISLFIVSKLGEGEWCVRVCVCVCVCLLHVKFLPLIHSTFAVRILFFLES